jgi:hypothetical protein
MEAERKRLKAIRKYEQYLRSLKILTGESKYGDFAEMIQNNSSFASISHEEKEKIFITYVQSLSPVSSFIPLIPLIHLLNGIDVIDWVVLYVVFDI